MPIPMVIMLHLPYKACLLEQDTAMYLNGNTALDMAGMAEHGVLQRLELLKKNNGCFSCSSSFTTIQRYKAARWPAAR